MNEEIKQITNIDVAIQHFESGASGENPNNMCGEDAKILIAELRILEHELQYQKLFSQDMVRELGKVQAENADLKNNKAYLEYILERACERTGTTGKAKLVIDKYTGGVTENGDITREEVAMLINEIYNLQRDLNGVNKENAAYKNMHVYPAITCTKDAIVPSVFKPSIIQVENKFVTSADKAAKDFADAQAGVNSWKRAEEIREQIKDLPDTLRQEAHTSCSIPDLDKFIKEQKQ